MSLTVPTPARPGSASPLTDADLDRLRMALAQLACELDEQMRSASATLAELRRSRHHPQWGIVSIDLDVRNQKGQPVMSMRLANLVEARNPEAGTQAQVGQPYDIEQGGQP